MDELTPIYRIEHFLDAIVNNSVNPYSPEFRVEYYLAKIAGENVTIPEPIYRKEFYLAYLCGEEVELPDPIYRIEYYLAFLCGLNVELPEPIYRVEFWLWDWCGGGGIEKTVTGNPIHITDALAKPAQALSIALEPIQDLNGYANPWPAGGGKNKLPITIETSTTSDVTFTVNADGTISTSGTATADINKVINATTKLVSGESYKLAGCASGSDGSNYYMRSTRGITTGSTDTGFSSSVTATSEALYLFIHISNGVNTNGLVFKPMICLASETDSSFAPYSNICPISGHTDADVIVSPTLNPSDGTTYPIPLGQTVYGGTLDVTTGVLTVDRAIADLGTLTWTKGQITTAGAVYQTRWYSNAVSNMSGSVNTANGICSQYAVVPYSGSSSNPNVLLNGKRDNVASSEVRGYIQIVDSSKDNLTAAEVKTSLSGVQFCYDLATPQTIQLTPTQVELLQGENNLFSDGEMTLVYLADGNASDAEALNILLGGRYVNNHTEDEPSDREALDIVLGGKK